MRRFILLLLAVLITLQSYSIIPDRKYMKKARKAARAKWVVTFRKPKRLDIRDFRIMFKVKKKLPSFVVDLFFPHILRCIDFLLTKRIVK